MKNNESSFQTFIILVLISFTIGAVIGIRIATEKKEYPSEFIAIQRVNGSFIFAQEVEEGVWVEEYFSGLWEKKWTPTEGRLNFSADQIEISSASRRGKK